MPKEPPGRYWKVAGYVRSGPNRVRVLMVLDRPQTPNEIRKGSDMGIKLVSRALCQMEEKGVVECKNPDAKRGRIYGLTDIGRRVLRDLQASPAGADKSDARG